MLFFRYSYPPLFFVFPFFFSPFILFHFLQLFLVFTALAMKKKSIIAGKHWMSAQKLYSFPCSFIWFILVWIRTCWPLFAIAGLRWIVAWVPTNAIQEYINIRKFLSNPFPRHKTLFSVMHAVLRDVPLCVRALGRYRLSMSHWSLPSFRCCLCLLNLVLILLFFPQTKKFPGVLPAPNNVYKHNIYIMVWKLEGVWY